MKKLLITIPILGCAHTIAVQQLSEITYIRNNASSDHTLRSALNGVMNERDELLEAAIEIINESNDQGKVTVAKTAYTNFKTQLRKLNIEMGLLEGPLLDVRSCDDKDISGKHEIFRQKLIEYDRLHVHVLRTFGSVSDTILDLITELPSEYAKFKTPDKFITASKCYLDASCKVMMMNKIAKIITDRSDECGLASQRDAFYDYAIDGINELIDKSEESLSSSPKDINGDVDIEKIKKIRDSVDTHYKSATATFEAFSTSLLKKYSDKGITVQSKSLNDILSKLRGVTNISGFSMPFILSTIAFVFVNLYF
ncbi:uncharacterized protein BEWA_041210 [Theileria equi strain WA]|uniref:Membrane protein, putative n=1 Tax=Theileria equi strain WA TaxID=1537102 RepID=L1LFZ3_THEEQ|nr:uncharacterized protein BEWA_041210 [Theileria equi strain WA]EKX74083.1 membrane protein, putative [Theileria equi strain WA]|eukprot:XP_004833535.1 uncharacterized protein BEWA_041210 [Theileria equi strain WA]